MNWRLVIGLVCLGGVVGAQSLNLWPQGAPGGSAAKGPEGDTTTAKDGLVAGKPVVRLGNVSSPTLTYYPSKGSNSGAAIVVFPGGGYHILAMDLEGTEVCDWLTSSGIGCALLKYRVPDSGPYPKSSAALQDAQRAVGLVRQHAAEWKIDPQRIGVLGFSAGAHLAAALSTHFEKRLYEPVDAADSLSCRPDFAVIVYPGYLALEDKGFAPNPDIQPSANTPPAFIVQTEDDPVHVESATAYFQALKRAKVPAELHIYAAGGHGYGLRRSEYPVTTWPQSVETWLHTLKVIPGPAATAGIAKSPQDQIASAVLAAPAELRDGAAVLGYDAQGKLTKLREGKNEMVCLASDPAKTSFSVACYHKDLEPFMARGRELTAQGVKGAERNKVRFEEVKSGKLPMSHEPRTLYVLTGSGFNAATGKVQDAYLRWVIYVPFATPESTGLSTQASDSAPWLMAPGTAGAHIMINPPKK
jgi:acetyl esterase/lipase